MIPIIQDAAHALNYFAGSLAALLILVPLALIIYVGMSSLSSVKVANKGLSGSD
jgi:hypothetical protein